jgi:hypothetical protein
MNWTDKENDAVMGDMPLKDIARALNRTVDAVRQQRFVLRRTQYVSESPYPKYTEPLKVETDKILILPDVELPLHDASFINKCIDLALSWKVDNLLCAGDLFHLDALTGWEASWNKVVRNYMDERTKDKLNDIFLKIKDEKVREEAFVAIDDLKPKTNGSFAEEISISKKVITELNVFKNRYHIMGNHEGRLLRLIESSMEADNLKDMFKMDGWNMSEYYFAEVLCKEKYKIAHPKPFGKTAATEMASKYLCHYIMGHSHDWSVRKDRSGTFWAIQMGHCADEKKFAYESQRDRTYWAHSHGAVIIRDGYPFLLGEETPWSLMKRM